MNNIVRVLCTIIAHGFYCIIISIIQPNYLKNLLVNMENVLQLKRKYSKKLIYYVTQKHSIYWLSENKIEITEREAANGLASSSKRPPNFSEVIELYTNHRILIKI